MTQGSYKQFCPVAMAAELLCTRWTVVLLRELCAGSTRFNDLRRGLPRMSPALLSQRLKELEAAGVVVRAASPRDPAIGEYHLTDAGRELEKIVDAFGVLNPLLDRAMGSSKLSRELVRDLDARN